MREPAGTSKQDRNLFNMRILQPGRSSEDCNLTDAGADSAEGAQEAPMQVEQLFMAQGHVINGSKAWKGFDKRLQGLACPSAYPKHGRAEQLFMADHQQPEVNYLPSVSPQLISLEK